MGLSSRSRKVVGISCLIGILTGTLVSNNAFALTCGTFASEGLPYENESGEEIGVSGIDAGVIYDESILFDGKYQVYVGGIKAFTDANNIIANLKVDADYGICQLKAGTSVTEKAGSGDIVAKIEGTVYARVIGAVNDYFQVELGAFSGYIKKDYVSFVEMPMGYLVQNVAAKEARQQIIDKAAEYLGVDYVWGGTSPSGFDCSGLVQYVYNSMGIELPRVAEDQCRATTVVSIVELLPADLVFFKNESGIHHVGIYVGGGKFIHAPYSGTTVQYSTLRSGHYREEFYCGGRVIF